MRADTLGRIGGGIFGALVAIVLVWGETAGLVHAFRRHGTGDGWAAVLVPPWACYRGVEMFFHQTPQPMIGADAPRNPDARREAPQSPVNPPQKYTSRADFGSACWWLDEYRDLVARASEASDGILIARYATESDGTRFAEVAIRVVHDRGACLYFSPPEDSFMRRNLGTGQVEAQELAVIWDTDLDGVPDGYWSGTKHERLGDLTGFEEEDFAGTGAGSQFLHFWISCVGFATNHFLHRVDSSLPRD